MQKYQTKKRFGQHFLHDQSIVQNIVSSIHPKPDDQIIEIGPGLGALTFPLLEKVNHLHLVEIDRDIIQRLREQQDPRITIHAIDALKFDTSSVNSPAHDEDNSHSSCSSHSSLRPLRIVGNLPYNISTPLIFHLLETSSSIQDMHFMLQKEVVDRMTAVPNTKVYGRLSVMVQYHCQTENLFNVPPGAFRPPPKVDSAVIRLIPWENKPYQAKDEKMLSHLVNQAFMKRRKTIRNALKELLTQEQIEQAGIDSGLRPENLQVGDFVKLSSLISVPVSKPAS
ncbi:MAG: 16S rRNA (adenine(1518)-N(6)/adenine(1519)-N(6))-dimethyltransferase RsmA [Thiotrichaceae bacterium]